MPELTTYDLFISYVEADRAWVEGYLLDALTQAGVKCLSEAAFRLGVPRIQEFQRAIQQSSRTLLVISPAYVADDFNQFVELLGQSYGQDTQTWPVIPLVLELVALPPRLAMLVGLDATTPEDQEIAVARLCTDLQHSISSSITKPACPYPGMLPFSEADRDRFFGRDQEINELVERLRAHPFVTVIGPSGSGKSSLVFAGLIPNLRQSGLFGTGDWLVLSMRPGTTPLQTLQALLRSDLSDPSQTVEQVLLAEPNSQRLLLVIDQFEELFTQQGQEINPFQQLILKLIDVPQCYVVLTVRADFYSDLMTSPFWNRIQLSRMEVLPLDEAGLKQAVLKPAESVEVFIEPALVERLVDDASGEPGVLPLVQETLVLLWERVERRFLPLRAYEALVLPRDAYGGFSKGHRTGLQVAIARRADAALASLKIDPEKQYKIARRIFIRLVHFGEGRADTRRRQLVNELQAINDDPRLFQQTLEHLIDCRLLTSDRDEKNSSLKTVDIAHEALISGWPTLQHWIFDHREAEQTRRRLTDKAKEWERLGKKNGGLLDAIEILESERWLASATAIDLSYDKLLDDFIKASKNEVSRARYIKKIVTGAISILGITVLVASGVAWKQQVETNNMQIILDVQLGNIKPETLVVILPILNSYLEKAKEAQDNAHKFYKGNNNSAAFKFEEIGIKYSRAVLDTIFRIENSNFRINELELALTTIKPIKAEANSIMDELIVPYGINKIEDKLRNNQIGDVKSTTYLRYEEKFTPNSALKATYEVIMIDLGADINRVGTLTPNEANRIPCPLLNKIDELWRRYTDNQCGWYSSTARLKGGQCIQDYDGTLAALIFPEISYSYVINRLDYCKVKNTPTTR
jgi:NACHT domain/TIR domain